MKYTDEKTNKCLGRSELERRVRYIEILESGFLKPSREGDHPLMTLIKQCLYDDRSKRPTSLQLTEYFIIKDDMSYCEHIVDTARQVYMSFKISVHHVWAL